MHTVMMGTHQDILHGTAKLDIVTKKVLSICLKLGLNATAMFAFAYISMMCFYCLCERQIHIIRKRFFYAVLHQDMEWFDVNQVGALTQKMSSGIDRIKDGMSDKVGVICHACTSLISGTCLAFYMNWKMALIMWAVAPCITLSLFFSANAMKKAIRVEMNAYSFAGAIAAEVISGIRTVMSFNAQQFEINRYQQCLKKARKLGIRKATITGLFSGIFTFFMNAAMAIGFYFGSTLVFKGEMESGKVFGVFWAIMLGAMRIGQCVPNMNAILSAKMAAGEIFSIIDRKPKFDCSTNVGLKLKDVKGEIAFQDVHFTYPSRPTIKVLNGVSFNVKSGQKVAFVGHSGCGKSTTVGLLMRFYEASKGSITLDNTPLKDLNIAWLRETMGIVSQEPVLFASSVEDNLRLGEEIPFPDLEEACRTANAIDFITKLPQGFQTIIGEGGVKLSGGQKQRLAIARALVRNPKVLLLDEATSALDTESERLVQDALDRASQGRTTITIAHRLSTIKNADLIIVFEKGIIVEEGSHESLLEQNGVYAHLVSAQTINRTEDENEAEYESAEDETFSRSHLRKDESEEAGDLARRARASERLSKSMTNAETDMAEVLDVEEEVHEEGAARSTFRDIFKYARPERKYFITGLICSITTGIRYPLYSILVGQLFLALAKLRYGEGLNECFWISVGFFLLAIISGFASFFSGFFLGSAGEKMASRLRTAVFTNIMHQDGYYFDKPSHSTGKLTSRLATDAHNVQGAIDQRLSEVLVGITSLVSGVIIAIWWGPIVAPVCLITSIIVVVYQLSMTNHLKRRGQKDISVADEASRIANETIENVKTVQALARQKNLYANFCAASAKPHRRAIIRGFFQSSIYSLGLSFSGLNFTISYALGVFLIKGGYTMPQTLFQVVEALNIASIIIIATSSYFPEYLKARLSAGLMFQMMHENAKIDAMNDDGLTPAVDGNIQFKKVTFAYPNGGKQLTLNNLSFSVLEGKTVALVGPSGSGKSTVVQLIERFYDVLNGNVNIDKFDIRQLNVPWMRCASSVVGQEPTLFNLSVKENIAYGMKDIALTKVIEAAKLANIHDFIESLPESYETNIGNKGTQLSGGQRQRIAIARAMIRDPKILLLDEATSALDTESERIVQEALERASEGRTCVTIAHRLSTIQNADIIVVIREGKVVEYGNHQQLLSQKGLYYRMVQKQHMD
uniref:ABC-type xenobiotic transporter n=1 Tax=Panagrolaimus superbus TaxID=310955 RepID=A0A914YVY4_9BILA